MNSRTAILFFFLHCFIFSLILFMMVIFCLVIHSSLIPSTNICWEPTVCWAQQWAKQREKYFFIWPWVNTEVISKANSRTGTVLVAVLLLWEIGEQSNSYRRRKRSVVSLLSSFRALITVGSKQVRHRSSSWEFSNLIQRIQRRPSSLLGFWKRKTQPQRHTCFTVTLTPIRPHLWILPSYWRWLFMTRGGWTRGGDCKSVLSLSFQASVLFRPLGGDIELRKWCWFCMRWGTVLCGPDLVLNSPHCTEETVATPKINLSHPLLIPISVYFGT